MKWRRAQIGAVIENKEGEDLHKIETGALIAEIDGSEDAGALFDGICFEIIGRTADSGEIEIASTGEKISMEEMITAWSEPLRVYSRHGQRKTGRRSRLSFAGRSAVSPAVKTARPKVFIPVFPGTNCEMDSKRAFERAGGEVEMQILVNLTPEVLDESIHQMAKKIRQSQIIMIPGGFSGGDEPDGSAKFITAVFRNPAVSDARLPNS